MQVAAYTFGSVPLKTYLPDGDIDLSLFQKSGASLKYVWFDRLKAAFISEQQKTGPTRVSDVQFINAEVCSSNIAQKLSNCCSVEICRHNLLHAV